MKLFNHKLLKVTLIYLTFKCIWYLFITIDIGVDFK